MIEGAGYEGLQAPPIDLQIFSCIHAGILHFAQRFRAQCSQRDHQDFRKRGLDLFQQIARFFRTQVENENRRAVLLQDGFKTVRRTDVAHLRQGAEESLHAADEIGILRIEDAYGG